MTSDGTAWSREFNEAKVLGDDCFVLLQERNGLLQTTSAESDASVARLSAGARRKVNALNSMIDRLEANLGEGGVSDKEQDRRRNMIARLRTHAQQLGKLVQTRKAVLKTEKGSSPGALQQPRETLETAERDELGLLVLQRQIIQDQDEQLDDLARVVTNTRHIALAVNEELDLHSRLLDDIEDDVEHTTGRLTIASRKIKTLMRQSRDCKLMVCLVFTIIALIVVLVLTLKLAPLG